MLNHDNTNLIMVCFIIFVILSCNLIGGCLKREGMRNMKLYSKIYNQSETKILNSENNNGMFIFSNNEFNPNCCEYSNISSSNGCVCHTSEQQKMLFKRAGNHNCGKDMFEI